MIDDRDRKILTILQKNAAAPVTEIADRVALSVSACSRRIARLEAEGYILRRVAVLDRERMGVPTIVFALVKTTRHAEEWVERFRKAIADIPEVVEAHRLTGNFDYLLKILLPRAEHYDQVYREIIRKVELFDVSASISMEVMKADEGMPVSYAG